MKISDVDWDRHYRSAARAYRAEKNRNLKGWAYFGVLHRAWHGENGPVACLCPQCRLFRRQSQAFDSLREAQDELEVLGRIPPPTNPPLW